MGVLTEGKALRWEETTAETRQYVKNHGVLQFISNYLKNKDRIDEKLIWGDEIEYIMVKVNKERKVAQLLLASDVLLKKLTEKEIQYEKGNLPDMKQPSGSWKPEYGKFMIESTPYRPYGSDIIDLLKVEDNMRNRRLEAREFLTDDVYLMCLSCYPMMGSLWSDFVTPTPEKKNLGPISNSYYISDEVINPHIRFGTLTYNIRIRRGSKVCILVPLYMDLKTNPLIGLAIQSVNLNALQNGSTIEYRKSEDNSDCPIENLKVTVVNQVHGKPLTVTIDDSHCNQSPTFCNQFIKNKQPSIYMDAMAFGMGCGCQQTTYQLKTITEARFLYDQLVAICPIFLSLTASTPILKSLLADTDARWNVVSASVDDRIPSEKSRILKSRYDSVSLFISNCVAAEKFSDIDIDVDQTTYDIVSNVGVDHQLARHIGHLFIRDPLVIFSDFEEVDDNSHTDHFENIQSTNWQTVRFKPPPNQNSEIGWRVEFRVMELQLSDFANAAFAIFSTLMVRAILAYRLNFYMPISKIDENLKIAHKRDSILNDKFNFVFDPTRPIEDENVDIHSVYRPMTINEVINGTDKNLTENNIQPFIGIANIIYKYLDEYGTSLSLEERKKLNTYIEFISLRASGKLQTPAHYIRTFVQSHPKYEFDSVVSEEIGFDLLEHLRSIQTEKIKPSELCI